MKTLRKKTKKAISFLLMLVMATSWAYGLIPGAEKFSPEVKVAEAANTKIRQEINITDQYIYAASGSYATSSAIINIDPSKYTGATYYLEIVASTTSATNASIYLRNATSSVTLSTITANGTSYARYRSTAAFTPSSMGTDYVVVLGNESVGKGIIAARIIIIHDSASITNTRTEVEIGSATTTASNTATLPLQYPKYWYYDSNKWNGSPSFYAEATYKVNPGYVSSSTTYSTAGTYTVAIPSDTYATSTLVELWGGGGAGGSANGNPAGGSGGAGGAYARSRLNGLSGDKTLVVASETAGVVNVAGSRGATSTWETSVVIAGGGAGGGIDGAASTTGDTTGSVGDTKYAGGGGGRGVNAASGTGYGGGGGGGAGSTGVGSSSSGAGVAGGSTSENGGAGGDKQTTANAGNAGTQAGGGGGGGWTNKTTNKAGGAGAAGMARITHNVSATTTKVGIALEEDDGTFNNWAFKKMIVTGGTATSAALASSTLFTPTSGRNYRIVASTTPQSGAANYSYEIYNAKIVVDQTSPTKLQPQYLLANTLVNAIGLTDFDTLASSTEWSTSNTYVHQIDSSTDSADSAKLQSNPNVTPADITNSAATGANRATSTSFSMPTGTEAERTIATYVSNVPIYASRILVDVDATSYMSLSGTAYQSEGGSALTSRSVKIYKNGSTLIGSATTNASDGTWNATVTSNPVSGDVLTIYIDGDATYKGSTILVSNATEQTNVNIYGGVLTLRDDANGIVTNAEIQTGWVDDYTDMMATTSGSTNLTATSSAEIHIWTEDTYTPGGTVTTQGSGNLHIDDNATANLNTASNTIAGNAIIDSGATLSVTAATTISGDVSLTGTLSGTGNLTVNGGDVTGSGTINMTGGLFTLDSTGLFGSDSNWTFNELKFGDGTGVATTTSTGSGETYTATTTISANQILDAGVSKVWTLNSSFEPFQLFGTFLASTSTFKYQSANNTTVTSATYYNLETSPSSGNPTYVVNGGASSGWYSTGGTWGYRKKITIDNTKVSGAADLTDFPVLIDLTDSGLQANAQSDGDDILFTDSSGNKLSHEIEIYTSATGRLTAWVKVPALDGDADTDIYMYYGNSSATSQQNAAGVWDSNYKGVWHFDESGSTLYDSTSNARNATKKSSTQPAQTAGKIGYGQNFVGTGDSVNNDYATFSPTTPSINFTVSFWMNTTKVGYGVLIAQYDGSSEDTWNSIYTTWYPDMKLEMRSHWGNSTYGTVPENTTQYVTWTKNGDSGDIYVNGVATSTFSGLGTGSEYFGIFGFNIQNAIWNSPNGMVDEMRVSDTVRSADWIVTEYNNQSATSTFYKSIGAQESGGGSSLTISNNFTIGGAGNVTLDVNTKDPDIIINGNLTIGSGDTFSASNSGTLYIAGNFSNSGTFTHNNGTVVFNGSSNSTISSTADITFYNLSVTTPGKIIKFAKHTANVPTFSFDDQFTVTGQDGNPIYIESDTSGNQWLVDFNVGQTAITNASIKDSACAVGSLSVSYSITNSGRGNNGSCWNLVNRGATSTDRVTSVEQGTGGGTLKTGGATSTPGSTESGSGGGTLCGGLPCDGDPGGGGGAVEGASAINFDYFIEFFKKFLAAL